VATNVIASHQRSYEREVVVFDPLHYLALIEQKTRALDQAAPLAGWQLPECFVSTLRRLLEARLKKHGSREYVQVLRLMETFALGRSNSCRRRCLAAGHDQLRRRASSAAVPYRATGRRGWTCRTIPTCRWREVRTTQAADYMTLLAEACA
jgi:hypothetical protein